MSKSWPSVRTSLSLKEMRDGKTTTMANTITKVQLYKTISYRLLSSAIGWVVLYISTGNPWVSSGWSAFELVIKPVIYFAHEKLWEGAEKRAMKKQPE